MKLKPFVLGTLIVFLFTSSLFAWNNTDTTLLSEENFLVGEFQRSELQKGDFGEYFKKEYPSYHPCDDVIRSLETKIYQYTIVVVLATWCHDSHIQVPRFYKILDQLDYETAYIKNICLDKNKEAEGIDISELNIEKVPTFIFYEGDKEIGRIVESPKTSLEKDTFIILSK